MTNRKLQAEIDRTLKKVAEGVEIFEDIYEKLNAASSMPQKEKLEQDLKKEIKKLQRLRDQIKTWASSNDVKDKKPLLDNRKLIETQMERFKAVEKEMKRKAYSKEGLSAASKLDPKEKEKMDVSNWLTSTVDELDRQVEALEAESETLQVNVKKSKKDTSKLDRLTEVEQLIERHKWHQGKLELILRLLENGSIEPDAVKNIKDDVQYYVDSCQEQDFDEDEGIYDDLNLEDEEEVFGMNDNDIQSSRGDSSVTDDVVAAAVAAATQVTPTSQIPKTPLKETIGKKSPINTLNNSTEDKNGNLDDSHGEKSPISPGSGKGHTNFIKPILSTPVRKPTLELPKLGPKTPIIPEQSSPISKTPNGPMSKIGSNMTSSTKLPSTKPIGEPIRYAAAAAAAASVTSVPPPSLSNQSHVSISTSKVENSEQSTPSNVIEEISNVIATSPSIDRTSNIDEMIDCSPKSPSEGMSFSTDKGKSHGLDSGLSFNTSAPTISTPNVSAYNTEDVPLQRMDNVPNISSSSNEVPSSSPEIKLPSSLTDLVSSFEAAKQKALARQEANKRFSIQVHEYLENSFQNVPDALDSDRPKYYLPRNPFPTPQHYPQQPPPIFDNVTLFEKFDIDTLFYIFYYQQGTYQQYLAARELRKQSWRFHKKYLTWFQRHEEPKAITDEYEQGTYIYFDFEGSWVQRKKTEFRFEYRYLEDELI